MRQALCRKLSQTRGEYCNCAAINFLTLMPAPRGRRQQRHSSSRQSCSSGCAAAAAHARTRQCLSQTLSLRSMAHFAGISGRSQRAVPKQRRLQPWSQEGTSRLSTVGSLHIRTTTNGRLRWLSNLMTKSHAPHHRAQERLPRSTSG